MDLDPDTCYEALLSRDRRFDGRFFVGVRTTGIYCRPVCAVRSPMRRNCAFFASPAAAEKAGFRPCLRCRPELAPGHGLPDMCSRLAQAAAGLIDEGFLNTASVAALARRVGVTERHLRRIFGAEFGVSMLDLAQTQRLLLAKRLLTETGLPVTDVALAAGFGSVRRFNHLFLQRYGMNPRRLRKAADGVPAQTLTFALGYRPPLAWAELLGFLAQRCIAGVEHVERGRYARTLELQHGGHDFIGWIAVAHAPARFVVEVTLPVTLTPVVAPILARVRRLLDLGASPDLIDLHLGDLAAGQPGLRVPGAFDGFEVAVRAIVGQQISVAHARAVLGRIAQAFGTRVEAAPCGLTTTFPRASVLAGADAAALQDTGITRMRAGAIIAVADAVATGRIALDPRAPLDATLAALRGIPGIGEWTVQYIAMRALAWPNAFPDGDAVLKRRLGCASASALRRHAARWEPWRAYAVLHLWRQDERSQPLCTAI